MHNYQGDPTNNAATIPLVDDADLNPPTAANLDLTGQALADRSAYRARAAFATAVANWRSPMAGTIVSSSAAWDAFAQRWVFWVPSSTGTVYATNDGQSYFPLNTSSAPTTGFTTVIGVRPSDGLIVAAKTATGGAATVVTYDQSSNPAHATEHLVTALDGIIFATMLVSLVSPAPAVKFVVVGCAGTLPAAGKAAWSSDGATWTSITLPAGWSTVSESVQQYISCTGVDPQTGVDLLPPLVAMCGQVVGTDPSRLLSINTGNVPVLATDITPAFVGTTYGIRGIAYDVENLLVGILAQDSTGKASVWTSDFTLTTWTKVHEWGATAGSFSAGGLTTLGGVWVVVLRDSTRNDGTNRVFYCGDITRGVSCTWSVADYFDGAFLDASRGARLLSNGRQVLKLQIGLDSGDTASVNVMSQKVPYLPQSPAF